MLTGAGCSTESNLPDYRSPSGAYSRGFKPMTHQLFMSGPASQSRYWCAGPPAGLTLIGSGLAEQAHLHCHGVQLEQCSMAEAPGTGCASPKSL